MTLEDAKTILKERQGFHLDHGSINSIGHASGLTEALNILAKVDSPEPDEEGRAVLWLMREKGWEMAQNRKGVWSMDGMPIKCPVTEAKKLGWGG